MRTSGADLSSLLLIHSLQYHGYGLSCEADRLLLIALIDLFPIFPRSAALPLFSSRKKVRRRNHGGSSGGLLELRKVTLPCLECAYCERVDGMVSSVSTRQRQRCGISCWGVEEEKTEHSRAEPALRRNQYCSTGRGWLITL